MKEQLQISIVDEAVLGRIIIPDCRPSRFARFENSLKSSND